MPVTLTYPGVYIEEVPSGVRAITGVATSITAFVGRAARGPVDEPVRIQSFGDYERIFGGLWTESTLSYAVQHFFLNGGADAIVVRVHNHARAATVTLNSQLEPLKLEASSPGAWGERLCATVDYETANQNDKNLFNLTIVELDTLDSTEAHTVATETFRNLSVLPDSPRFVATVLAQESKLMQVQGDVPTERPIAVSVQSAEPGDDGYNLEDGHILGEQNRRTGIYALEKADIFNLLCIPPLSHTAGVNYAATLSPAASYCRGRHAILLVDPPPASAGWSTVADAQRGVDDLRTLMGSDLASNVAVFFPNLRLADPLKENRLAEFAPCGAVAGVIARTDAQRGVWKAPAGTDASLVGVRKLAYKLTDGENGQLNPLGLNCLRTFPVTGHVVWGARTLAGADRLASEWKYLPVRRLALFVEESLYRGTQWAVFEPNDEPLWAQLRLNVGTFMQDLFRQGAFQGKSPREAYFVKCDKETTTQSDIDKGIVNIHVGFAPLKPAEFVVIRIQQIAGQTAA